MVAACSEQGVEVLQAEGDALRHGLIRQRTSGAEGESLSSFEDKVERSDVWSIST